MLGRAASKYTASNGHKQASFSPTTNDIADNSGLNRQQTLPQQRDVQQSLFAQKLQQPLQTSTSAINVSNGTTTAYKNPLKRTSSQANYSSRSSTSSSHTARSYSTTPSLGSDSSRNSSMAGTSVLNKLHGEVFWDENDFIDDADLNFDEDDSPIQTKRGPPPKAKEELYPTLQENSPRQVLRLAPEKTVNYPDLSKSLPNSVPKQVHIPPLSDHEPRGHSSKSTYPPSLSASKAFKPPSLSSSASFNEPSLPPAIPPKAFKTPGAWPETSTQLKTSQIDWSSSPPEHKATPPNANMFHRNKATSIDLTQESPRTRTSEEEDIRPSKRRSKLPWLQEQAQDQGNDFDGNMQAKYGFNGHAAQTPRSKISSEPNQAWNKTASAIKEEQKRHRQQRTSTKQMAVKEIPASQGSAAKAKASNKKLARIFLSEEQKSVLDLVVDGKKSVFFTGSAGTGKSVLMREIIKELKKKHAKEPDRVAVTASTGLAACNIGGVTLHSFSGIGLGKEPAEQLIKKIKRNSKSKQRWQRTKCLVIDEISMVDGDLFDKLEHCARVIRGNGRPFGGIQLIVTGDFFQLPPVPEGGKAAKFSFDASTWSTSIQHTIGLTHVFRQRDEEFAAMLNEMRTGILSNESVRKFKELCRAPKDDNFIDATDLYSTRHEVAKANGDRMRKLSGETVEYGAIDGGSIQDIEQRTKLLSNCMAEQTILLKKGAQVMLIKNLDDTLVNGSIGRVIGFMDEKTYDIYHDSDASDVKAFEDLISEGGDGLPGGRAKIEALMNKDHQGSSLKWPLVRFRLADGTSRDLLCTRESWKIEQPNGEIQASRNQIPLILAWALSIHKAQGQTLERVRVNLQRVFEKGQAYVALSRATSREGLQILNFNAKKVQAHPRVTSFYKSLYSVMEANGT